MYAVRSDSAYIHSLDRLARRPTQEFMEELLAAVLVCLLAVPILGFLGSYTRRVRAQLAVHKIGDPAIAHRALIDNADDFSDRPAGIFPVSLATWRDGEPNENVTTVSYGRHWSALRCNLAADILHPTRLASLAPLQQEAARALVACLSGAGAEVADVREHVTAAVFALVAQLCFGEDAAVDDVRAMGSMIREFLFAAGELSPRFDGSTLSKVLNWRGLRGITGMIRRQGELYLPLIEARRGRRPRLPLCAGGGIPVHPYVGSLLDLRVPDQGNVLRALRDGECWSSLVPDKLRREIIAAEGSGQSLRSMPYLDAVVLESLRMHPPVPFIMRGAHGEGAKAIIGGTAAVVPVDGLRVLFNLGDIGRDNKTWTDPDRFRPERFLAGGEAEDIGPSPGPKEIRMMPLGAGHRHCPGMNMGMLNIKCFLCRAGA
ncbi:hypothetical protein ACQ4PT_071154 [Festuca glaucescens]